MVLLSNKSTALNVDIPGTVGSFRVSKEDGEKAGVEVKYILTHVTLSQKAGQLQLLDMLAPVREVFDLKQLDFDEIMQRDIEDSRVSLELIPYLLDASVSGQIKLFPPIVVIVLPLKPLSKMPADLYNKVELAKTPSAAHSGYSEQRLTAGQLGQEQFQFLEYVDSNGAVSPDSARLLLSRDNCALAIVDGQHRAMALLALHRNLTGTWTDSRRAPYERYYKVWPEKEIRSYNLDDLQMPMIICTFPQLDVDCKDNLDVVRAARRVFLTLNKTAKKVSESRNRLLNDQDIVAECLRETLSHIKQLAEKDDTAVRIWNVELDQEGDRVKVNSDVAFSGVSHLYHMAEHILMSSDYVRGLEARSKIGAPKRKLAEAYQRLGLKDTIPQDKREANTRTNYSDEIAQEFRAQWRARYVPVIDKLFGKFVPLSAFARATLWLKEELKGRHEPELESILFDGEGTARTFDEFREGLDRRFKDKEPGWTSPAIVETLTRVEGLVKKRRELIGEMRAKRAAHLLEALSTATLKKLAPDGQMHQGLRDAIDRMYENVFETVAFQTALICTFTEAIEQAQIADESAQASALDNYVDSLHKFFRPGSLKDLERLMQTFEGKLESDPDVRVVLGGPTFRGVVLTGEMQPAEWPKYRYLLLELWTPVDPELQKLVETDRIACRKRVAKDLLARKVRQYCDDNAVAVEDITKDKRAELTAKAKTDYETFLANVRGKATPLAASDFEGAVPVPMTDNEA
ncbi:hypothetical protein GHT07_18980 [Caenimonas koreensis DSM 17982]|uniref:DNA-sulfur modification-associated n=1 Tax=Caenimonas koreensis DSM 17982 TaxID=1121255 RepID=A0A844AYC5_9BURK|nr:DNA sulfur modification protein DndB [Caenimonas koreensis]MRD49365.1 hypothetical protein [Caenimonas koreensis DSM 17982]